MIHNWLCVFHNVGKSEILVTFDIFFQINGTELKDSNVADCINIIKAATERVTLKILKPKPTQAVDQADSKPKPIKPSRPAEAAEPDIVPKSNIDLANFRLIFPYYTP